MFILLKVKKTKKAKSSFFFVEFSMVEKRQKWSYEPVMITQQPTPTTGQILTQAIVVMCHYVGKGIRDVTASDNLLCFASLVPELEMYSINILLTIKTSTWYQ